MNLHCSGISSYAVGSGSMFLSFSVVSPNLTLALTSVSKRKAFALQVFKIKAAGYIFVSSFPHGDKSHVHTRSIQSDIPILFLSKT